MSSAPDIRTLLTEAAARLRAAGVESPRGEAELLLADLLGVDRATLLARDDRRLSPPDEAGFRDRIARRVRRAPVSQILGRREFFGRSFQVTPDVLTPRPETELIVEVVLEFLSAPAPTPAPADELARINKRKVLDLCCGSGCIGVSLACEAPEIQLSMSDISPPALAVARENLEALAPQATTRNARLIHSDLFAAISDADFAVIACNPPYIHPEERDALEPEVRDFEPGLALFHPDPPELYRRIMLESARRLQPDGMLVLELGVRWAEELRDFALGLFERAELRKDYAGQPRALLARKPSKNDQRALKSATQRT